MMVTPVPAPRARRADRCDRPGATDYPARAAARCEQAKRLTGGRGVDLVLDVGGVDTLAQTQAALGPHGLIAAIGLLTGKPLWTLSEQPARTVRIRVGSRTSFEAMNRAIDAQGIRPVIDRVYPLAQLGLALEALRSGRVFGKVAIQFDEPA